MRELTLDEIDQVSGGVAPIVIMGGALAGGFVVGVAGAAAAHFLKKYVFK